MEELIGQATISGLLVGALVWVFRSFVPRLMAREDKARADERAVWLSERDKDREVLRELAEAIQKCPVRSPAPVDGKSDELRVHAPSEAGA